MIKEFENTGHSLWVLCLYVYNRRVARGGIGGFVPLPFHPKILQFARVFEKNTENPPPKIFPFNKF